ncbi:MAG TPA: RloB family protein [Tenuifilaceae bacterium]|nr:RloB family protein [Tenuifilaceae bacterium]
MDGETEVWYLNMLKRNERHIRITIKPEIPSKKSIAEQFEFVCALTKKEYAHVFWIVDLDTIQKETRETPKGETSPIEFFKDCRRKLKKDYKNVTVVVINPCLEFWFLLHFEQTSRVFNNCKKVESQLKNHLKCYEKTQYYYTKQNNDIYLKLKPYLNSALENAAALGSFNEANPYKAICEMKAFFLSKGIKKIFTSTTQQNPTTKKR